MIFVEPGQITIYDRSDISRIEVISWYLSEWEHRPKLVLVIAHCITMFYDLGPEFLLTKIDSIYEQYDVERT